MAKGRSRRGRRREGGAAEGALSSRLTRRQFITGLAAAGALNFDKCGGGRQSSERLALPDPSSSGIDHVVVLMMENRSFDHFFNWVPGARSVKLTYFYDKQGVGHATYPLAPEFQGCHFGDPDHSYEGGRIQFNDGALDGWLRASTDDLFPIGYYTAADLDFFRGAVPEFTVLDDYYCSILSQTFPNRIFQHAAQTDRLANTFDQANIPTIWDRLAEKGLSHAYYYSDLPVTALWGGRLSSISKTLDAFLADAAAGWLPSVSFVDPRFLGEEVGTSNDDHPFADIRNGQAFINQIYEAVTGSPNWPNTVFIINYDEWGGFYDHASPPLAPLTDLDRAIGNDGRLGFRVPCLVVSPLARRGFVAKEQYDHTSILAMIEWRWGLDPLTPRDAGARNLAHVLDFRRPKDTRAPRFGVPAGPFGEPCAERLAQQSDFAKLKALALAHGFPIPGAR